MSKGYAYRAIATGQINDFLLMIIPLQDIFKIEDQIESNYQFWFNDLEVCKYTSHAIFPFDPTWNLENFLKNRTQIVWAIVDWNNYLHIGNVSLQQIDLVNRSAEFACIIGEPEYWNKGITTWACQEIIKHGFLRIGLNRIYGGTSQLNLGMQKVFKNCGFIHEGYNREAQLIDGKFVDIHQFSILNNEWLKSQKS